MPADLLTVQKTAEILGLSPRRVRVLCRTGRLGRKIADRWVITAEEVEDFRKLARPPGWKKGRARVTP